MEEYPRRPHHTACARDFYDIHAIVTQREVDLGSEGNVALIRAMFAAKEVSTGLLGLIEKYRDFHRADWPSVEISVRGGVSQGFDYYFGFVVAEVRKLQALGVVDTPGLVVGGVAQPVG